MKRYFNTSGPNNPKKHYTLKREKLIQHGIDLVADERYFTIWAPRQTGKSTYFRLLAEELKKKNYKPAYINFEDFIQAPLQTFLDLFSREINKFWNTSFTPINIPHIFNEIADYNSQKHVLIIDEVEGINSEYLGTFLHAVRRLYHSRENHCLKSVILVGVSNIVGVVNDNASPFNIADNLGLPYFTNEETFELLEQHEKETQQQFATSVKRKIAEMTANQPGLVNGFARKLVLNHPEKEVIEYEDYLQVESWYLTETIDKNFSNILNKSKEHRHFVERLLFTEDKIPFKIDRPGIKLLHTNGLIKRDKNGFVEFWVPFYKKRLYDSFYPYTNGEKQGISRTILAEEHFTPTGDLKLEKWVQTYKEYVKRRGFNPYREKDKDGNYQSIKEAALIYSFETYIHAFISQTDGKIYREANTGLGRSDMIVNVRNKEYLIETKIYYAPKQFETGKQQLAYYCQSLQQTKGVYLVFCPNDIRYPDTVKEQTETIEDIEIITFLIGYDESKWEK